MSVKSRLVKVLRHGSGVRAAVIRGMVAAIVLAVVAAAVAVTRHGASGSASAAESPAPPSGTDFAILARAPTAADDLPDAVAQAVFGADSRNVVAQSRWIPTPSGRGWVVATESDLCDVVPDPVDGYGVMCTRANVARRRGAFGLMVGGGTASLTLVLPRGATAAQQLSSGAEKPLSADADDVITTVVDKTAIAVSITQPNGDTTRLPLPVPPHKVGPPTAPGTLPATG